MIIDQACEVKMAGWLAKFLRLWTERVSWTKTLRQILVYLGTHSACQ